MKKTVFIAFALLIGLNVFGQRGTRNRTGLPQTNREPTEKEIAKRKQMIEDRKDEYVANFLTTLEADDFQKQIIKQTINSFYDAKLVIVKKKYDRIFDRDQAIKQLEDTHFVELEELISENDMKKIKEMIKGNFDEKEAKKEKKKKKKRKKKKEKEEDKG